MKKKLLLLSFGLLMLFAFAAPVMAESQNKTHVTVNIKTLGIQYDPFTYRRVTPGNVSHIEYMRLWGTIKINVDGQVIPVTWVDILTGNYNIKQNQSIWKWAEVWTMPNGDTFEGTAHITLEGGLGNLASYTELTAHIILHGTGDYEGQTLSVRMHYIRPATGFYEGYWLKY